MLRISLPISILGKPYLVNPDGIVKSLDYSVGHWRGGKKITKGRTMIPIVRKGYLYINVSDGEKRTQKSIHRLVAESFIPNPENKPQVNHKNGIKKDNRVENLEWATGSENTQHAFDTGLKKKKFGSDNPQTKLSETDKGYIRKLLIYGARQKDVAKLYNVSPALICLIN